jgi:Ca2+-transporting ATPase
VTDRNPWLWRMVVAMVLLLVAMLGLPWLRSLMGLALPGMGGLAAGAALLALSLAWLELLRTVNRRWPRPSAAPRPA